MKQKRRNLPCQHLIAYRLPIPASTTKSTWEQRDEPAIYQAIRVPPKSIPIKNNILTNKSDNEKHSLLLGHELLLTDPVYCDHPEADDLRSPIRLMFTTFSTRKILAMLNFKR